MYHEDFLQSLGIILTSTPASMDAYKMFTDLNQSSKSTRAVAKSSFQDKTWTKEYFQGAHAFKDMIGIVRITAETVDEIVRNLKEFQPVLSVQINIFTALAAFTRSFIH